MERVASIAGLAVLPHSIKSASKYTCRAARCHPAQVLCWPPTLPTRPWLQARERQSLLEQLRTAEQVGSGRAANRCLFSLWNDLLPACLQVSCPQASHAALPWRFTHQVRFQLERAQEGLQRQLLHAEGGISVLEARLEDAQSGGDGAIALRRTVLAKSPSAT